MGNAQSLPSASHPDVTEPALFLEFLFGALGFRVLVTKFLVVTQLLMGEIPPRGTFMQPAAPTPRPPPPKPAPRPTAPPAGSSFDDMLDDVPF
jgi:hypothetical protein